MSTLATWLWPYRLGQATPEKIAFYRDFRREGFSQALAAAAIVAALFTLIILARIADNSISSVMSTIWWRYLLVIGMLPLLIGLAVADWLRRHKLLIRQRWLDLATRENFPWVVAAIQAPALIALVMQASMIQPSDAHCVSKTISCGFEAFHIRLLFTYFFLTLLYRLPFSFASILSIASFVPIAVLLLSLGDSNYSRMVISVGGVIALGLFTARRLEDRAWDAFRRLRDTESQKEASVRAQAEADQHREIAETQAAEAQRQREIAETQAAEAQRQREIADTQAAEAQRQREMAENARIEAERQRELLETTQRADEEKQQIAYQQIQSTLQHAQTLVQSKNRFFAHASHDLRNQLASVTFHLYRAHAEAVPGSVTEAALRDSEEVLRNTAALLTEFNQLSRYEAGVAKPDIGPVDLKAMLAELELQHQGEAKAKNIIFRIEKPRFHPYFVSSDRLMLCRVLQNLIGNAIKYTPATSEPPGRVIVRTNRIEDQIQVSVEDTGIGVEPKNQRLIFEPLVQLHNPERNPTQGYGLGLAVVQTFCAALQHRLEFESEVGVGSTFSLRIPISVSHYSAESTIQDHLEQTDVNSEDYDPSALLTGKQVLLLEDMKSVRESFEKLLLSWGARLAQGGSFDELEKFLVREHVPDLLISDYHLAGNTKGSDAVHAVRRFFDEDIPAILVTADPVGAERALEGVGNLQIYGKPFDPLLLKKALTRALVRN